MKTSNGWTWIDVKDELPKPEYKHGDYTRRCFVIILEKYSPYHKDEKPIPDIKIYADIATYDTIQRVWNCDSDKSRGINAMISPDDMPDEGTRKSVIYWYPVVIPAQIWTMTMNKRE